MTENKENSEVDKNQIYGLANEKLANMEKNKAPSGKVEVEYNGVKKTVHYIQSRENPKGWNLTKIE